MGFYREKPELYNRFKEREIFQATRISDAPFMIRLDGFRFSKLSERMSDGPLSPMFHECVVRAAETIMRRGVFNVPLAYVGSDEINLMVINLPFAGRVEKIVSVSSGIASAAASLCFSRVLGEEVSAPFDSRIVAVRAGEVPDYFVWRQMDVFRNFLNRMALLAKLSEGMSRREACEALRGVKGRELVHLIAERFGRLEKFPCWARLGTLLFFRKVEVEAVDRITGRKVRVARRRVDRACFSFRDEYGRLRSLLHQLLP